MKAAFISTTDWPEAICILAGAMCVPFLSLPFAPRIIGLALYFGMAWSVCERWQPRRQAKPADRFAHYLRVLGVFVGLLLFAYACGMLVGHLIQIASK